jgi:carbamoyl-phosphate synthase large subunit
MNVLISAAGRRVRLVQLFQEAARRLALDTRVVACDMNPLAAALYAADDRFVTPPADDARFPDHVLHACQERDIRLIVSVNDHELVPLADARDRFDRAGVHVAVSAPEAVRTCRDKRATHAWLASLGFPVPGQWRPDAVPRDALFPLIVKPAHGSAGIGVREVRTPAELDAALRATPDATVEERLAGREFTVNVFASRDGRLVCAVPHIRVEVRAGEVSKGRTFRHARLADLARDLVARLPGCRGALNFQGFLLDSDDVRITEINPRFGGGYPLAHAAGARFPDWLLLEMHGRPLPEVFDAWQSDVVMLRYDHEILLRRAADDRLEPL